MKKQYEEKHIHLEKNLEKKLEDMSLQIQNISRKEVRQPLEQTEQQELEEEENSDEDVETDFSEDSFRLDKNAVYGIHNDEDNRILDLDAPENGNESLSLEEPYFKPRQSTSKDKEPEPNPTTPISKTKIPNNTFIDELLR